VTGNCWCSGARMLWEEPPRRRHGRGIPEGPDPNCQACHTKDGPVSTPVSTPRLYPRVALAFFCLSSSPNGDFQRTTRVLPTTKATSGSLLKGNCRVRRPLLSFAQHVAERNSQSIIPA
jgi:hypothetical protein